MEVEAKRWFDDAEKPFRRRDFQPGGSRGAGQVVHGSDRDASVLGELVQKLPVGFQRVQFGARPRRRPLDGLVRDDPAARPKQTRDLLQGTDHIALVREEEARICQVKWTTERRDVDVAHVAWQDGHVVEPEGRDCRSRTLYG